MQAFLRAGRWLRTNAAELLVMSSISISMIVVGGVRLGLMRHSSIYLTGAVSVCVCFSYVLQRRLSFFESIWNNEGGKLLYGLLAVSALTFSQTLANETIRLILQTHPDQFPDAQRNLVFFALIILGVVAVMLVLFVIYILSFLNVFTSTLKAIWFSRPGLKHKPIVEFTAIAYSLLFVLLGVQVFGIVRDEAGRPYNLDEEIILAFSFVPNDVNSPKTLLGSATSKPFSPHLFCLDLPPHVFVSPASPDDVMPDRVVVAEPKGVDYSGRRYTFRFAKCGNSGNREQESTVDENKNDVVRE